MLKSLRGKIATILFGVVAELLFLSLYGESLVELHRGTPFSGINFRGQPISVFVKFACSLVAVIAIPVGVSRMIRPTEKKHHRDKIIDPLKPQSGNPSK